MSLFGGLKFGSKKSLRGGIEGISAGIVFGWAVSRRNPANPVRLDVLVDGKLIGVCDAVAPRPDIAISAASGHRCGFRYDLRQYIQGATAVRLTLRDAGDGTPLAGTPLEFSADFGWGAIDGFAGIDVSGWAVVADPGEQFAEVEILIDDQLAVCVRADRLRPDLTRAGVPRVKCGFRAAIPRRWHDGLPHAIAARVRGSARLLRGSLSGIRCEIRGHVDAMARSQVTGWIANVEAPEHPVRFDVWVNGECAKKSVVPDLRREDVEVALFGAPEPRCLAGFAVGLPARLNWDEELNFVEIRAPDSDEVLLAGSSVAINRLALVRYAEELAANLNGDLPTGGRIGLAQALPLAWRTQIMPLVLQNLRTAWSMEPIRVHNYRVASPGVESGQDRSREITDVVVPVYKGYRETLDCLRSVLAARADAPMELIVINDKSPDPQLCAELRRLAAREGFTLLENDKNRGFVATVNRGMRLHADRDVVLLNSDTVVPRGWLKALRRAAHSAPNIGTVTPFSNRATIFSLPRTNFDNEMPLGMSVDEVSALCSDRNDGIVVDVPTAMGFCMYIRREALRDVGEFDEKRWAMGYGEENDFCLRAWAMGWRSVAACDVFVQHHGSVSFQGDKAPRVRENLAKLNALYPDYPQRIQRFIRADPLAAARGRVNIELIRRLGSSFILFITHGLGGGTEKAIRDLCVQHAAEGKTVLILRSTPSERLELAPAVTGHEAALTTEYPHETASAVLAEHLRGLPIEYVHYHHSLGFRSEIWELPGLLGVPYDVHIHDFYLVCPRINLLDDSGVYCGQPEIGACEACVRGAPLAHDADERLTEIGGSVSRWREFHAAMLQGARRVIAPSEDARSRIQKYLPGLVIDAIPHPEPALVFKQREWNGTPPYRVAVIGAIGPHKGVNLLLECARYAHRRGLPIQFVVIGYTSRDDDFAELDNVEITGPYKPEDLRSILADSGCAVALYLSICPETYSFTLSEAWSAGLYPFALDVGAPAERIRERGDGTLIPLQSSAAEVVGILVSALERRSGEPPGVCATCK